MLHERDRVSYRLLPEMASSRATVLSVDGEIILLRIGEDAPEDIPVGRHIAVVCEGTDTDCFAEVLAREGDILRVKQKWTGRRSFFRVDDTLPLVCRRVTDEQRARKSRVFPWYGADAPEFETPDDAIDPRIWGLFVEINTKLGLVLDNLLSENRQLQLKKSESKPVNISASGIRFAVREPWALDDVVELKMFLTLRPPLGIIAFGKVVRAEKLKNGDYGVALQFVDLDDEAQDVIIRYTMKRQREMMRNRSPREAGI